MTDARYKPTVAERFGSKMRSMPGWQRLILLLSLIVGIAGGVGSVVSYFKTSSETSPAQSSADIPSGARGAVDASSQRDGGSVSPESTQSPTFWQRMAPHARNFGFSVIIGFIAGFFFRTFLKTMAFLTAVVVAGFFLLSYFNVLNVDIAGMKTQYDSIAHWLTDQGTRLKDVVFSYLPSTGGALVGAFLGFLQR